jgi:hypothetical protein
MRTTVDLPAAAHHRAKQIADGRGQSLSSVVAELTVRGLAALDEDAEDGAITQDPKSGFPTVNVGRRVGPADVDSLWGGD